jgi:uncharacterized membrane protein YccC
VETLSYGSAHKILRHEWPNLVLAVRGTLAALLALTIAVALGLECPYWAAMTALIVIQPTRGLLLEKSYFRPVGTAFGAGAGLLILLVTRSPLLISLLISLWLASCVGVGNLLYGLRSYGAMVAGCTCAVVAMAGYNNPPHLHDLVFGRIAGIIIGIIISTTVTLYFTRRSSKREVLERVSQAVISSLEWTAHLIRGCDRTELNVLRKSILTELADIENSLDAYWAGSLDLKKRKQLVNSLIVSLLSHIEAATLAEKQLQLQSHSIASWRGPLADKLELTVDCLQEHGLSNYDPSGLSGVITELSSRLPLLATSLDDIMTSLHVAVVLWDATMPAIERPAATPYIRHRDWQEAGRAALRAACAMAGVGLAWYITGWNESPLMIMAASIMVSFFSIHDRPAVTLGHIFCGAVLGVTAAFITRLLVLPGASSILLQLLVCIPVLLAGSIALHHRSTARGAMDAMLFFLFVMQPGLPAVPPAATYALGGLACLGGIGVAILSFRFLLPVDPERRLNSLLVAIVRDLLAIAGSDSAHNFEKSRYRMQHRVLRLLTNARKIDADISSVVEGGLAALVIGSCLQRLRDNESNDTTNLILETSRQLSVAAQQPDTILPLFESLAFKLWLATEPISEVCSFPAESEEFTRQREKLFLMESWHVGTGKHACLT